MLGSQGSILYVGKAKNLKNRITTYCRMKPGICPDHLIEMIDIIQNIRWRECKSEADAFLRESELLHAIRPPYNTAHTESEHYLFIGVRAEKAPKLTFQLSSRMEIRREGYEIYGCFNHRRKIKSGYTALLRLLYAAHFGGTRFSYPARLTRVSPPWIYSIQISEDLSPELDAFLSGQSERLLHTLVGRLLENENIPPFMRPSIQEDIELVRSFYRVGPKLTHKRAKTSRSRVISHDQMDALIAKEADSYSQNDENMSILAL